MSTHDDFRTDEQMEENRKYWTEGPGSKKPSKHEEGGVMVPDPEEGETGTDEDTGLSAIVGTLSATAEPSAGTHSVAASSSSGGLFGPGGGTTSPPFAPYPTTTSPPGWGSTTTTTFPPVTPAPAKRKKPVRLPPEFTNKVLLAFLDPELDDDDPASVSWAAHLLPLHFEMVKDEDGRITLEVTFSLEDVYENNDE